MQEEGWWLVCADVATDTMKALKRVTVLDSSTVSLNILSPPAASGKPYHYALFLISDVYLGLDQQLDFSLVAV